jgi:hypothetical protein
MRSGVGESAPVAGSVAPDVVVGLDTLVLGPVVVVGRLVVVEELVVVGAGWKRTVASARLSPSAGSRSEATVATFCAVPVNEVAAS